MYFLTSTTASTLGFSLAINEREKLMDDYATELQAELGMEQWLAHLALSKTSNSSSSNTKSKAFTTAPSAALLRALL